MNYLKNWLIFYKLLNEFSLQCFSVNFKQRKYITLDVRLFLFCGGFLQIKSCFIVWINIKHWIMPEHLTVVAGKTVKELFQEHVLKFSQQWRKEMVRMYVSRSFLLLLIVSSSVFLLSTNFSSHFISPFYYLFFFFFKLSHSPFSSSLIEFSPSTLPFTIRFQPFYWE